MPPFLKTCLICLGVGAVAGFGLKLIEELGGPDWLSGSAGTAVIVAVVLVIWNGIAGNSSAAESDDAPKERRD